MPAIQAAVTRRPAMNRARKIVFGPWRAKNRSDAGSVRTAKRWIGSQIIRTGQRNRGHQPGRGGDGLVSSLRPQRRPIQ